MPNDKKIKLQLSGEGMSMVREISVTDAQRVISAALDGGTDGGGHHAIDGYRATWNTATHVGQIQVRVLHPTQNAWGYLLTLYPEGPAEMNVLLALLGSGLPVETDPDGKSLFLVNPLPLPPGGNST